MKKHSFKHLKIMMLIASSSGLVSTGAYAGGLPVIDITNIIQTTISAIENITQSATQAEQLAQQVTTYNSMTGSYGMGDLLPASSDTQTRRWAPENWQESLAVIQSGGIPGGNSYINDAMAAIKAKQNMKYGSELFTTTDGNMARLANYHDTNVSTNLAAMSLSDAAYSSTDERTTNIESLNAQIDTAYDQKAALDLNNRLMVQMLHQQNQALQVMAMQAQANSTNNYRSASVQASRSEFNTFDPY